MREISLKDLPQDNTADIKEALEKISEGLLLLGKMNSQMSSSIAEAVERAISNMPQPKPVDLSPLVKDSKPTAYKFIVKRDSTRHITEVDAKPYEPS